LLPSRGPSLGNENESSSGLLSFSGIGSKKKKRAVGLLAFTFRDLGLARSGGRLLGFIHAHIEYKETICVLDLPTCGA
jgi:hypothetical protein